MADYALFQQKMAGRENPEGHINAPQPHAAQDEAEALPQHRSDAEPRVDLWLCPKGEWLFVASGLGDHPRCYRDQDKLNMVAVLIRFYADQEDSDKVCAVYEKDVASLADAMRRLVFVDPRLERSLMDVAI